MKTVMEKETVMKVKKENHQKRPSKVQLQVSLLVLEEVVEEWLVAVECHLVKGVEVEACEVWACLAEVCLVNEVAVV